MEVARRPDPVDVVVAVALMVAAQVEIWAPGVVPGVGDVTGNRAVLTVGALLSTLPLAWRRLFTLTSCSIALVAGGLVGLATTPTEGLSSLIAFLLAAFTLGLLLDGTRRLVGIAVLVLSGAAIGGADWAFVLVLGLGAWTAGLAVNIRDHSVKTLRADNAALERARHEAAQRGAADERARIARELHDVVSHRVSMMVIQSQAADALLDTDTTRARESVRAVEESGRHALTELRALLGLLRDGDDVPSGPTLQPGIDEVDALVSGARQAGVDVTLSKAGPLGGVPHPIGAAAYRVVQEALTNVVKHGGGAPATVTVEANGDRLLVEVDDAGPASAAPTPGHGFAGMAERVSFVGGELSTGPRDGGGFRVRALLPLRAEAR